MNRAESVLHETDSKLDEYKEHISDDEVSQ